MKTSLFLVCAVVVGILLASHSGEAAQRTVRKAHTANECAYCHTGQTAPTQAGVIKCQSCHMSPDKVAEKTQHLGKMNPHTSPHWGTTTPCWFCHKEHAEDVNYCRTCHM